MPVVELEAGKSGQNIADATKSLLDTWQCSKKSLEWFLIQQMSTQVSKKEVRNFTVETFFTNF